VIAPWFVRQPALLRSECDALARDFPEMRRDEAAFASGRLVVEGIVSVAVGNHNEDVTLVLAYPDGFPYARPEVVPVHGRSAGAPREPRFFSARHQMASGMICLFERDPTDDPHSYVTGVAALRRACTWLRYAVRGVFPAELDTLESELESHYDRFGDVIVGPLMFSELGAAGDLVFVNFRGGTRSDQYPLFVVTHVESGGTWRSDGGSLHRVVPWPKAFWDATPPQGNGATRVRWYSLDREPPPVRTSKELAQLLFPNESDSLAHLKRAVARELAASVAIDVPVRIPGRRAGTYEWLFFRFPIRESTQPRQRVEGIAQAGIVLDFSKSDVLDGATPLILRVHDLRPASLQIRNTRRIPVESSGLSVGLAGAGALGSTCADLLAKAGVGAMRIVDPDLVNAHNAVRHIGGIGTIGLPKPMVVAASVSDHNPHCDVSHEGWKKGVLDLQPSDPLWEMTAVLSTIADDMIELALNRFAIARGTTVYYLRALRSGSTGRLLRVRPGIDACLECIGHYHAEGDSRAVIVLPQGDEVIARECGQPVLAASAADLAVVAGLGVRTFVHDLVHASQQNQWVWTSEGIPEHEALAKPFSSVALTLPPHPKCGVCAADAPRRVRISATLRAEMTRQARHHAPNETGGILVGRRDGDLLEVLRVSDAGPKAISEPTKFERDGEHCQAFLERSALELGDGADYVGEWHSHPGSSASPSARDTTSFADIASDPDYLTMAPLLIIVAPSASDGSVDWSFTIFPDGGVAQVAKPEEDA
jgi:integrative and conjugative element protein (TIGR02256 family)